MSISQTMLSITFVALILPQRTRAAPVPQAGDGGGSSELNEGSLGYDPSATGERDPGSAGTDTGGVTLNKGAIAAICVVGGIVIIAGVTMAILFWGAKRRQWQVATTMRRSVKRVTTGLNKIVTPRTPHKMTFSPVEKARAGSAGDKLLYMQSQAKLQRSYDEKARGPTDSTALPTQPAYPQKNHSSVNEAGLSQSLGAPSSASNSAGRKTGRPTPPRVQVPQSKFEMESPKTPMWKQVFGRG